ncbi:MAG: DUF6531 domain-containing protein [Agarilytica sp.]
MNNYLDKIVEYATHNIHIAKRALIVAVLSTASIYAFASTNSCAYSATMGSGDVFSCFSELDCIATTINEYVPFRQKPPMQCYEYAGWSGSQNVVSPIPNRFKVLVGTIYSTTSQVCHPESGGFITYHGICDCDWFHRYDYGTGTCGAPFWSRDVNSGAPLQCGGTDPVNVLTGNHFQRESIFSGAGSFPLRFNWVYNSNRDGWQHNYQATFRYESIVDISGNTEITYGVITESDGRGVYFNPTAQNTWAAPGSVKERLAFEQVGNIIGDETSVVYTDKKNTKYYFFTGDSNGAGGRLEKIAHQNGLSQTLNYSETTSENSTGNLLSVTDGLGKSISFEYDAENNLVAVIAPDNKTTTFSYDTNGMLSKITYPDATPTNTADNLYREFHYEDARFLNILTGITNERGIRYATWTHDDQGRAISAPHAEYDATVSIDYVDDTHSRVTNSLGGDTMYEYGYIDGVAKLTNAVGSLGGACQ